jgi:hypothetical protein
MRAVILLVSETQRAFARGLIDKAPPYSRLEIKGPRRTLEQNDMMWGLLTNLSNQLVWHGQKLSPEDWKLVMLDGLKRERRLVPNIDGDGFVDLGRSSRDLSKEEMSQLIELIYAFGAQHDVKFSYGEDG